MNVFSQAFVMLMQTVKISLERIVVLASPVLPETELPAQVLANNCYVEVYIHLLYNRVETWVLTRVGEEYTPMHRI